MEDHAPLIGAALGALGVTSLAYIAEVELVRDLLTGFGLGALVGTAIAFTRRRRRPSPEIAYTVNLTGLVGAGGALVFYVAAELL